MNTPKCDELDYIYFLVAAQKVFSNTEAANPPTDWKQWPPELCSGTHDAYTRLLHRCQSDGEALWLKGYGFIKVFKIVAPNGG